MFDNKKVRISTIITFYNGQISFLKELIESIEVSIDRLIQIQKQNLIEHNLVIINDSINKAVEGILEVFIDGYRSKSFSNIVLIHNSINLGIIGSRLKGLKYIGESDIVHIIDQDDKIDNNFYSIANKIFHVNKEISKDFYSKTLKGLKILNQMGLITGKELEFRRRIDRSLRILRKGFKNCKISDWKNLISDFPCIKNKIAR